MMHSASAPRGTSFSTRSRSASVTTSATGRSAADGSPRTLPSCCLHEWVCHFFSAIDHPMRQFVPQSSRSLVTLPHRKCPENQN